MNLGTAMFIVYLLGFGMGSMIGTVFTHESVSKHQVDQALQKCKNGEWDKIDQTTIYCTDGVEYKLEGK